MGRPVNKRYFGSGSGNQIKVRFKTGGTEYDGYVLSQRGTTKFRVSDGTRTIIARLVNKSAGALNNGEMIINVLTDAGTFVQATKLYNRVAIVEGNQKVKWNFAANQSDGAVRVADVEGSNQLTISIGTQPTAQTVDDGDPATFTVVATGVGDLAYQWQVSTDSGSTWAAISGATSASLVVESDDTEYVTGNEFRVVVSSTSGAAEAVTSDEVALTITPI
jgi:hypothetical protein